MKSREVVITGIGLLSSLGEGIDSHWQALNAPGAPSPVIDADRFAPFVVHPLPEVEWGSQIPRRGDLRQMDNWQRLGVYTAGMALDDAGIKGDEALTGSMDMIVAAAGGERDQAVDEAVLEASKTRNDFPVLLNEMLSTELRPTLFLAQLSNLMAGNISIVHKVTGSSRTYMGEEGSGLSAVEHALARIRSGQSTHLLVGGAYFAEGLDFLLTQELGRVLHEGAWRPVWQRGSSPGGGLITGSGSAFMVLEERTHAESRGARIYASVGGVISDQVRRDPDYAGHLATLFEGLYGAGDIELVISGASGVDPATGAEREALQGTGAPYRAMSSMTGFLKEAQLPFATALAALAVDRRQAYQPFVSDNENKADGPVNAVLATSVGFTRSEGAVLINRVEK